MQLFDETGRPTFDFQDSAPPDLGLRDKVLRVGEFLDIVHDLLKPLTVTIRGEISSVSERGNAFYINLSDSTEKAVLNCFMWRRNGDYLRTVLREGSEVEVTGYPSIYKPFGKFSLNIEQVTPVGEGALRQAFEALKRQLEQDGYFAEERKRELPDYVQSIGLITSSFGDARKDFLTHLGEHGIQVHFHDVRVEGVNAVRSIVNAIEWFNKNTTDVQVLVLTRGGGSLESLQAFNSMEVAQAIYSSRIPVISAIGHENDVSISDLVADVRASTPTHAGKVLGHPWAMAKDRIGEIDRTMTRMFITAADDRRRQFDHLLDRMVHSYTAHLNRTVAKLETIEERSIRSYQAALSAAKNRLALTGASMVGNFRAVFTRFQQTEQRLKEAEYIIGKRLQKQQLKLEQTHMTFVSSVPSWWLRVGKHLDTLDRYLSLSDPRQKLKQGYSISYGPDKRVLKSIDSVAKGAIITTQIADGEITSSVTDTHDIEESV